MALGETLNLSQFKAPYLVSLELERVVYLHLYGLGVSVEWHNKHGETNGFPDMQVGIHQIDCKGSEKYPGSMFIGVDNYDQMERRLSYGPVWYVLNDLSVVSWAEFDELKVRKSGGWMMPSVGRSINEWLEEINGVRSGRRRSNVLQSTD